MCSGLVQGHGLSRDPTPEAERGFRRRIFAGPKELPDLGAFSRDFLETKSKSSQTLISIII